MAGGSSTASGTAAAATATSTLLAGEGDRSGWSPDQENESLSKYLLLILGGLSVLLVIWRASTLVIHYVRHVAGLSNEKQRFFATEDNKMSWFKKHMLYSPIFRKRRNQEFQLSSAINAGTLPTRFQLLFLIAYLATNVAFCVINIPWNGNFADTGKQLRNRTGTLATVNMIPLIIMAGRNNPLIALLGISFDTYNLLHRWLGRIVALESLAHFISFLAVSASTNKASWAGAWKTAYTVPYMQFGLVATIAMVVITIQACSISRHAFYETFKIMHILLAITVIVGVYYHFKAKDMIQMKWLYPVMVLWGLDRAARFLRIAYRNFGKGGTKCLVEALPGNACRVTVTMARPWAFRPGQHAYLYMPTIGFWQSHPFSVAWSEEADGAEEEKMAIHRQDILNMHKTTMSFVIRARTGFTQSLYKKASAQPEGRMNTMCMVEGPYGGIHLMHSYGTVMLFAGGVGITHQVPHVRDLVAGYANGTVATRKIVLVWIIQSPEHLEWIRPWMTEILAMEKRRDILRIMLFVSRPRSTKEIHSPSATVQMFPGRPNIETLLSIEMENQVGALGVTVCGPGALSDEVRLAVRNRQSKGHIDFVDEAFSW